MSSRATGEEPSAGQLKFFETKIRPVLVEHCYECHSGESKEIGGSLLVDSRDGMIGGGESGPVIVAGDPDASLLIQALRYEDTEMPPDGPLPQTVVKDFVRWVELGATDPRTETAPEDAKNTKHFKNTNDTKALWSFYARADVSIPEVENRSWPRDELDRFVLQRIESKSLSPTSDASPGTLIRRLYYDLIGLPPTTEQIAEFETDHQARGQKAVEDLVDGLLSSSQFGVRWGRHWLDVARYGESNGDDGLGRNATFPHAWRYRDYVVDAFNADTAYDRFLTEQIAGDLLPADSAEQRNRLLTATGFLAIGSKPAAAMNKDFPMDIVDDQINVVCTTVLGLSVACARCHDHKHDPIPTKDYYALAGIFTSTETLYGAAGNEKLTAPPTDLHALREKLTEVPPKIDRTPTPIFPNGYSDQIDELRPATHVSLKEKPIEIKPRSDCKYSDATFASVSDNEFDGKLPGAAPSYSVAFWFRNTMANDKRPITAYLFSRAKLSDKKLPGDHLGIGGSHDKAKTGKLFVFNGNDPKTKKSIGGTTVIKPKTWNHVVLVRDDQKVKVFLNGILELETKLQSTFGESTEFRLAARSDRFAPLEGNVGEFAIFDRAITDDEALLLHNASGQPKGFRAKPPVGWAMGVREKSKPANCKIHVNGQSKKLGPEIPRGILTAYRAVDSERGEDLSQISIDPKSSGRLQLARWLTKPEHPQTARVLVNRVWLHLFGKGLVATPDDFGVYGARPSHPELLDHLAERFVADGWSIKRLIRRIVLSRTYGLDSRCDSTLEKVDPENRWLARHGRRRLDAESLRDFMLTASGALDLSSGVGSAIEDVDMLINWPPGQSTNLHKRSLHRSIYLCYLRHAPPKELAAFDLPDGVAIAGEREQSTLPTQTLFLLNSDFVIDQSQILADKLLAKSDWNDAKRIETLFSTVLRRVPTEQEVIRSQKQVREISETMKTTISEPNRLRQAAWASLAQALLTTNEFRYID